MLERLSRGDRIAAGGAIALIIALFLPWYGFDFSAVDVPDNGFSNLVEGITASAFDALEVMDFVLLFAAAAVLAVLFLTANGNLDPSLRTWIESVGSFAALVVIFRMVDQPGPGQIISLKYGIFLALLGAVAISVGGLLNRRDA